MEINKKVIKELKDCLDEFDLNEIEYSYKDTKIKVSKKSNAEVVSSAPPATQKQVNQKDTTKEILGNKVTSPIIGTAYLAPEPGAKKFIDVGAQIKKGQTVMIVEAMKTMNHVPSPSSGIVKKILVQDGEAVEFGQTLVLLK